jgi:hypothetical protein
MSLGDHNPLVSYGTVKVVEGKYSTVRIVFDSDDGGFHLVEKSRHSNLERFHGSGQNVKIYKTLAGAEKAARKL